jgi:spore coat protein CotH
MTQPASPPPESTDEKRANAIIFDETRVHDVKIWMSAEDWQSILDDSRGDEPRAATFSLDGVTITNAGVRPSGESSRVAGNVKISLRVDFDAFEKKKLGGFDSIKVSGSWDDPFVVRDQLAYWYYRQFMPAPREVSAQLTVNGQTRGIFEVEEVWSKESIKGHFADASGTLYRIRGVAGIDPYGYLGPDPGLYVPMPWDAKGNHPMEAHAVIGEALRVLKEEPARLNEVMDVDNMLTYFAVSTILSNTDGFASGFEVDDVFEYHDPTTGRFFMLPWDPDNTFGSINDLPTRDIFDHYDTSALTTLMRTSYRDQFFAKVNAIMTAMPVEKVQAEIDRVATQVRPLVQADTLKMYPTAHFEYSVGYVKDFTTARYASLRQQTLQPAVGP